MTVTLAALAVAAVDPDGLARFWGGLLGWARGEDGTTLLPTDDTGFRLRFLPTDTPKAGQNPLHLDLTSTSPDDQRRTVARALGLGGRHVDVGQRPDEDHVVLGDPEANEFCVVGPGNAFLAGCGFVGALACDGSQQVGYFWSSALGWPLVWAEDQETAIRAPRGGPKISWGGPPFTPTTGRNRLHLELAVPEHGDRQVEVDRLLDLGAGRGDLEPCEAGGVTLTDPDGNRFCLLPSG